MRKNKILLLVSSLGCLVVLLFAAYDEGWRKDWRRAQHFIKSRLPKAEASAFSEMLRQIVVPELKVADRCVSCHVGMAPGETGIPGDRIYGAHPSIPHDPATLGCTVCHGGQGYATQKADAHGAVPHWPEPIRAGARRG